LKKALRTKNTIIGFSFEISSVKNKILKDIIKKILEEEKITPREFIINQMPELSSEGAKRNLFFELNNLKIIGIENDELNENKKKLRINFTLPKSCYATVALEFALRQAP